MSGSSFNHPPVDAPEFYGRLLNIISFSEAEFYRAGDEHLSYPEIFAMMKQVNAGLKEFKREKIALYTEKSATAYAAIFTIILSDNCWIPLEPIHPERRTLDMIALSEPAVILTDRELPQAIQKVAEAQGIKVIYLSDLIGGEAEAEFDPPSMENSDWVYIMFTSGSTGKPKGVPVTHENLINFVERTLEVLPLEKGEVFSDYHNFGFDLSVVYLFCCPFTQGAFAPALSMRDRVLPVNHLKRNDVTVLVSVPSLMSRLMIHARSRNLDLPVKLLFLAGEEFRLDQLAFAFNQLNIPEIYNFYGLTETAVENFFHRCSREDVEDFKSLGSVPIGKPLPGNHVRLSEASELLLAGIQISPGYLGGVSPEKFIEADGKRWFRTGDRMEVYEEKYFFRGRFDHQVKVSGYRIELAEIEICLRRLPEVDEAICFVAEEGKQSYLVAAILCSGDIDPDAHQGSLQNMLPDYMVPRRYVKLDQLRLNGNGKIDRAAVKKYCETGN